MAKVTRKNIDAFAKRLYSASGIVTEGLVKEIAATYLTLLIKNTPVKSGYLRRGWKIDGITRTGDTIKIVWTNPVEYAAYVEFGHRTNGGKGFVEGQFFVNKSRKQMRSRLKKLGGKAKVHFAKVILNE